MREIATLAGITSKRHDELLWKLGLENLCDSIFAAAIGTNERGEAAVEGNAEEEEARNNALLLSILTGEKSISLALEFLSRSFSRGHPRPLAQDRTSLSALT